jgi:hypothetical protein
VQGLTLAKRNETSTPKHKKHRLDGLRHSNQLLIKQRPAKLKKKAGVTGHHLNAVEIESNRTEFNIGLGRQFYLFKTISLELYIAPSIYLAHDENTTIVKSENQAEMETTGTEKFGTGQVIKPNFVFSIGYYINQ